MRPNEVALVQQLNNGLVQCERGPFQLPGINTHVRREVYVAQLIDSIRRVRFIPVMAARGIHPERANGLSLMFDPIKAAVLKLRAGEVDEACWLVFIFTHFGKHSRSGYRYAREVYSSLGMGPGWTYAKTHDDIDGFRAWLDASQAELMRGDHRGFGNHRKYQSLSAFKPNGTGDAFASYVMWVGQNGGHLALFNKALAIAKGDAAKAFDWLYSEMKHVKSFGRTARFDYLTMLGKLGIVNISPGSAYFSSSTGPIVGARLMLQGNTDTALSGKELDRRVGVLAQALGVGMQEMEDSLCNWQKTPDTYTRFNG